MTREEMYAALDNHIANNATAKKEDNTMIKADDTAKKATAKKATAKKAAAKKEDNTMIKADDTAKKATAKKEDNTMIKADDTAKKAAAEKAADTEFTFTVKRIYINESKFDVMRYGIDKDMSVYAFANIDGMGVRLHIGLTHPKYTDAKKAAETFESLQKAVAKKEDNTMIKADDTAKKATAKKATKTLDEYIKTGIIGNGWKFIFDTTESRTRLIFDTTPTEKQIEEIGKAGFYYSGKMKSYNKKLTLKAAAAAEELAKKL